MCGLAPEEYQGLDRFEARSRVVNQLQTIGLLAREQKHAAGQISVCSRTGDVIEPRMTEQWFMNTREMHKEAEKAIRAGQVCFKDFGYPQLDSIFINYIFKASASTVRQRCCLSWEFVSNLPL